MRISIDDLPHYSHVLEPAFGSASGAGLGTFPRRTAGAAAAHGELDPSDDARALEKFYIAFDLIDGLVKLRRDHRYGSGFPVFKKLQ